MVREVVTCVLLLAAPLMVVGEALAQSPQFGVVTQVFSSQDDSKVAQLGAGSVRLSANWNDIELCSSRLYGPSCFSWAALDDAMNRAIARQLEVVLSLAYTPAWSNPNGPNWMPGDMLDWQNFVEAIINRYGNYPYLVFGIWNEPNLDQFLMDDNYATFWGYLFQYANAARNNTKPWVRFGGPETSWHAINDGYFYQAISKATPYAKPQDVVTVHWYPDASWNLTTYTSHIRNWLGGGVPIWLTEVGVDSPYDTYQAQQLESQILIPFANRPYGEWQKIFLYQMHDHHWFNLTSDDWWSRPSWWKYYQYITGYTLPYSFHTVNIQSASGHYVVAEGNGGGAINADRTSAGPWETFVLWDFNNGQLRSGDPVAIQTGGGQFMWADGGGGSTFRAVGGYGQYEALVVVRLAGPGVISSGDAVAFRTLDGHYVVAEGGGGGVVNSDRQAIGAWETFTLTIQ